MTVSEYLYNAFAHRQHLLAVLLDPDKPRSLTPDGADMVLVGGSTMAHPEEVTGYVRALRSEMGENCPPLVLFPGDSSQLSSEVDAMLYLSVVSGRNPEYLIGQHVRSARAVRQSGVETIPTGYILLDGGTRYTTLCVTGTEPLSMEDTETIVDTALAAEMLGMRLIYLEAGSGAERPVPAQVIRAVAEAVHIPVIVGGGLRSKEAVRLAFEAGATMVVVGNYLEKNPNALHQLF